MWYGKGRFEEKCAAMSSDSDSNHSFLSEHSDGGDLPIFPTFSSPTKKEEPAAAPSGSSVTSPGGLITAALSGASISTPEKRPLPPSGSDLDHFSPHHTRTDKKTLEHTRKLARKAEELGKRIKIKRERDEKVDKYIRCGGVRALSDEWEETNRREASLSDCGDNEGTVGGSTSAADRDLQSFLPKKPPGQPFFVKPPDFITELYPPGYEDDPANNTSMFANVEDNLLTQQDPAILKTVICGEWLKLCYLHKPCPPLVWQWLFQVMCRSHDSELSSGAFRSLTSLIQIAKQRQDVSSILIPPLSDLTDIIVHLGAAPSSVAAGSLCQAMEEDSVFDVASPIQNLSHLLQYLTMCVKCGHEECYSVQEVETLIVLFVQMSLDHRICGEPIQYHVSLCIAALVSSVSSEQWAALLVRLVVRIISLSEHHHDKLYITYLMSGTSERLHQLQRELCRKSLEQLTEVEELKANDCALIRHVVEYFLGRQRSDSFEEYYTMFSVFSLVALYMHPSVIEWPSSQEKKELSRLLGTLHTSRIRDNPDHPERSVVKDLVIRIMLEVNTQKDKTSKQESLLAYMP